MSDTRDDLITVREAAKLRKLSRYAIYDLIRRGRLKAVERYGLLLVSRSEVEQFQPKNRGERSKGQL